MNEASKASSAFAASSWPPTEGMAALQESVPEAAEDVMVRPPAQKRPAPVATKKAEGVGTGSVEFPSLAVYEGHSSGQRIPFPVRSFKEVPVDKAPSLIRSHADGEEAVSAEEQDQKRARSSEQEFLDQAVDGIEQAAGAGKGSSSCASAPAAPAGGVPKLLSVERSVFGSIVLTMDMVQDHLPDSYLAAINQL